MASTPDEQARINDELLEALLKDGQGAVKRGDPPQLREVVTKGDDGFPAPVVAKVYEDAGVVRIWDRKTGEPSLTSRNMLPYQIKKLGPDGEAMFTQRAPTTPPARGKHKCLLHPDLRKEHPEYDTWGMPLCRKENLTSPLQVELHMEHRHKVEWQTIQRERERARQDEQMELQRQIARAAMARVG